MSLLDPSARARPLLKRSRPAYYPSEDSKRRRTSPTGAFSRLSLGPQDPQAQPPTDRALVQACTSRVPAADAWPGPDYTQTRLRAAAEPQCAFLPPAGLRSSTPPALLVPPDLAQRLAQSHKHALIHNDDDDHGYPRIVEIGDDDQPPGPAAEPMDID
ncbi:hypothetical protein PtA15_12A222 [Puccinia triticina]|uniref:Uncharacterized protein n=1 Tax=Puccinia triticina TaxID=208348 RepID=A0ABY7CZ54_9BASI|nr:uncharacterized protein PtA15_12A222 [Puccinia triticina]WAQ90235.1 hypothetical protein PtA15_12A222 [Puccinia triticina]